MKSTSTSTSKFLMEMGERLRECRSELHITQAEAAELLGLSLSFYGQIERGARKLSLEDLVLCEDKLGINSRYLLTGIRPLEQVVSDYLGDCPNEIRYDFEQMIKYAANLYKNMKK